MAAVTICSDFGAQGDVYYILILNKCFLLLLTKGILIIILILKEINPEYSLEGLILKLNLQYFGHMMQRSDSFEKTLILGKIEGRRKRGQQRQITTTDNFGQYISVAQFYYVQNEYNDKPQRAWGIHIHITNLAGVLKSRVIILPTKVRIVKTMVFQ